MYVGNIDMSTQLYQSMLTVVITLPTNIKIYTFIINRQGNRNNYIEVGEQNILLTLIIITFNIDRVTDIILSISTLDQLLHDSQFVVNHFHLILSLSVIIDIKYGIYIYYYEQYGGIINIIYINIESRYVSIIIIIFIIQHLIKL